jgi:multiple sugar transport system substrate-binding protein
LAQKPYAGVEATLLTFTGPQIAEPLQRRAPEFEARTGAKIKVVVVPFSDLYQQILTDATTGTNSYQGWVFAPQWMADFAPAGIMDDLTPRVGSNKAIAWNDIGAFFRNFSASYGGKILTIPFDGDFQMAYYRSDVLSELGLKAPQTWEEYIAVAKAAQGKDLNGDGKADYGSCIAKKRNAQSYWMFTSVIGAFVQTQGTKEGAFFDTTSMKPLVNNEAVAKALQLYKETTQYGPPDELNLDVGDTRGLFSSGRCALTLDWGDIGTLSIDPKTSKVKDKVGAVLMPGTRQVLDRTTGKLVNCDSKRCPYASNGINRAPFAAFGGWSGGINKAASDKVKAALFDFYAYVASPVASGRDVTIGITGFNPYRISHFKNLAPWIKAGFSEAGAKNYLGAIQQSLNSPNMVLDLRIPKNQQYQQVVLDKALAQYLAGELTVEQAMKQIYDGWEEITESEGRAAQLKAYRLTLSIDK